MEIRQPKSVRFQYCTTSAVQWQRWEVCYCHWACGWESCTSLGLPRMPWTLSGSFGFFWFQEFDMSKVIAQQIRSNDSFGVLVHCNATRPIHMAPLALCWGEMTQKNCKSQTGVNLNLRMMRHIPACERGLLLRAFCWPSAKHGGNLRECSSLFFVRSALNHRGEGLFVQEILWCLDSLTPKTFQKRCSQQWFDRIRSNQWLTIPDEETIVTGFFVGMITAFVFVVQLLQIW